MSKRRTEQIRTGNLFYLTDVSFNVQYSSILPSEFRLDVPLLGVRDMKGNR